MILMLLKGKFLGRDWITICPVKIPASDEDGVGGEWTWPSQALSQPLKHRYGIFKTDNTDTSIA